MTVSIQPWLHNIKLFFSHQSSLRKFGRILQAQSRDPLGPKVQNNRKVVRFSFAIYRKIINNYSKRLSKISWVVSGEQINYLPKPKAEANNWSARYWQLTIFAKIEFNNCFIIRSASLSFLGISSGSEAICHFHARAIAKMKKAWFHLRMSRILFAAKQSWMTLGMSRSFNIWRQLFAGHVLGCRPLKRKKNL